LEEYQKLDEGDASLQKWKESLGLSQTSGGPAKVVVSKLTLQTDSPFPLFVDFAGQPKDRWVIKEGCPVKVNLDFQVLNGIVTGLRYMHLVKRLGIKVDKSEEMLGSYPPGTFERVIDLGEMPSGLLARGVYDVVRLLYPSLTNILQDECCGG
jgi:Rho GDP-dissociation inhibitor